MSQTKYQLGRCIFTVSECDPLFRQELDQLLPAAGATRDCPKDQEFNIAYRGGGLREIVNVILKRHEGFLWIDAGMLIAPNGRKFLLAGKSNSGKSSLTMAMALGYNWQVITEDLLLVDLSADKMLSFSTPFSFKSGTIQLLESTLNIRIAEMLQGEWLPLSPIPERREYEAKIDFAILFGPRDAEQKVAVEHISHHEFVRSLVRCSNALRLRNASEKLMQYLTQATCLNLSFGSLRDRIDLLLSHGTENS